MSTISWTSPRASEVILPTSTVTSVARSSRCSRSSSPNRRTTAPRTGAGTSRHESYAVAARATAAATSSGVAQARDETGRPLTGESPDVVAADGGQVHAARGGGRLGARAEVGLGGEAHTSDDKAATTSSSVSTTCAAAGPSGMKESSAVTRSTGPV